MIKLFCQIKEKRTPRFKRISESKNLNDFASNETAQKKDFKFIVLVDENENIIDYEIKRDIK